MLPSFRRAGEGRGLYSPNRVPGQYPNYLYYCRFFHILQAERRQDSCAAGGRNPEKTGKKVKIGGKKPL
jgi:hypothetical protein